MSLVYQHDTRPVIKLRECGTRKVYTVYVSKETDTLYVGDAIGDIVCDHRAFAKERYEVVTEQENDWALLPFALVSGLLILGAMIGIILDLFFR